MARQRDDASRAARYDREALALWRAVGDEARIALILEAAAGHTAEAGQAARLLGAAARLREATGTLVELDPFNQAEVERITVGARAALGEAAFAAARAAGRTLTLAEAVAEAEAVITAAADATTGQSAPPAFGLSPREREVLRLIAAGRSNREIADALYISLPTAKVHVRSILTKLNLDSRTAAAAFAIHHDLA